MLQGGLKRVRVLMKDTWHGQTFSFLELLSELNTQHAIEATIGTDSESLSPFIARSKNCDSGQLYFRTFGSLRWPVDTGGLMPNEMSKLSSDIKHSLALSPALQNVTLCANSNVILLFIEDKLYTQSLLLASWLWVPFGKAMEYSQLSIHNSQDRDKTV